MEGFVQIDMASTVLKTLAMLFVVLALLLAVLFVLKKAAVLRRGPEGDVPIRLVSSFALSSKDRIAVVEIASEKIALGVSPGNIRFLTRIGGTHENS